MLTEDEKIAWGREEGRIRRLELEAVYSRPEHERQAVFLRVQEDAAARRRRMGFSAGQARDLVRAAQLADEALASEVKRRELAARRRQGSL